MGTKILIRFFDMSVVVVVSPTYSKNHDNLIITERERAHEIYYQQKDNVSDREQASV